MSKIKILCVGCFHGTIPKNLDRIAKKEKPDLILGSGDYAGIELERPMAYYEEQAIKKYGTIFSLWPKKIQAKFLKIEKKAVRNGFNVLIHFGKLGIPFYFVHGNWDDPSAISQLHFKNKKNMFFIHNKIEKFKNIVVIGYGGYRPVSVKEYLYKDIPNQTVRLSEVLEYKRKITNEMQKLFKKVGTKQTILLTHDPPYKTFDFLEVAKKYYGEKITRSMIEKYQPLICVCSHFHEYQGTMKIGKTVVVNVGYGKIGRMALLEIENRKVKVRLIRS